ncbi:transcription factor bHLH121 [Vigna radiata var. radiata]|uniref:Transcription factor bHLH121 n=1 Tax=Vigna radiata var. radiata TaxID=3916 RepID=A0A1S3VXV1_VIGRR|nr:transcription factor bHLH121 [Vigna radiata var. radiata]
MDCSAARKTQKADREKLRRDRLNEQFVELGNVLDPDRPKNDKATILSDTIQLLKDLTSQVSKLKEEYATLNEESRELTQEKNDLREEKASLKSDIDNLNNQYQQQLRTIFPWTAMDHSVVMAPPSYPFPMPVAVPPGSIPMQPFPYFTNQHPAVISNPHSTFVPYLAPNTIVEQQSTHYVSPPLHPGCRSNVSEKPESKSKSSRESKAEKNEDSNDVTTDLQLKTPGSSADQDLSSGQRKSGKFSRRESSCCSEGNTLGRCSSSHSAQDSSSSSAVASRKDNE